MSCEESLLNLISDIERRLGDFVSHHNNSKYVQEGYFTPQLRGKVSSGIYNMNSESFGYYRKVGGEVYINILYAYPAIALNGAGQIIIDGLPFRADGNGKGRYFPMSIGLYKGIKLAETKELHAMIFMESDNSWIELWQSNKNENENYSAIQPEQMTENLRIYLSGTYLTKD